LAARWLVFVCLCGVFPGFLWLIAVGGGAFEPSDFDIKAVNIDEAVAELFCVVDFLDGIVRVAAIIFSGPIAQGRLS